MSVVENPGQFWVQNIGSMLVELDKNDKETTDFYSEITIRKLMAVTSVQVGDIVAVKVSLEEQYFRAGTLFVQEDIIISRPWNFSLFIMKKVKIKVLVNCEFLN